MEFDDQVQKRLDEMIAQKDPRQNRWPEKCGGSRRALAVFIGPSPGGEKETGRRERDLVYISPHWNEPYCDPILNWSSGFRASFKPLVEAIFQMDYGKAGKLIALLNLDWQLNPESADVGIEYMREGCSHIFPIIAECDPLLIVPLDRKTFDVFQDELLRNGFDLDPVITEEILVKGQSKSDGFNYHRDIFAFKAEKEEKQFLVIKSMQHPARVYEEEYGARVGNAIRTAADQIWHGEAVNISIE